MTLINNYCIKLLYIQNYVCRYWTASSILNTCGNWPQHNYSVNYSKVIPNGCAVNVKCGESRCKFQLTTYSHLHPASIFDLVGDENVTDEDLQEETIPTNIETSV